jgi:hypothetical protein
LEGRKKKLAWVREKRGEVKKKKKSIELNEEINIGRDEKTWEREKELIGILRRENKKIVEGKKEGSKETKSELEWCGSSKSDMACFGEAKNISLSFRF